MIRFWLFSYVHCFSCKYYHHLASSGISFSDLLINLTYIISFSLFDRFRIKNMETRSKTRAEKQKNTNELEELPAKRTKIDENAEQETIKDTKMVRSTARTRKQKVIKQEIETMKITDLNDDCLEHIFLYLDVHDLLNVALSNTRFQYVACSAFAQKYRGKEMQIYDIVFMCGARRAPNPGCCKKCKGIGRGMGATLDGENICLKKIQRFMMVFGDLVSSICFDYSWNENKRYFENIVNNTILTHSLKSLVNIKFRNLPGILSIKFSKPLPQVKTVYIFNCDWDTTKIWLLSGIFPEQQQLAIYAYERSFERSAHTATDIKEILNRNPQLTTLKLNNDLCELDLIRFISEKTQFEELDIDCSNKIPLNERIHFPTLKRFRYDKPIKNGSEFPFSFDQLERLTLSLRDYMNIDQIDEIIRQNEKLVEVSLEDLKSSFSIMKSKELGRLPEIELKLSYQCKDEYTFDDIIMFVNQKSLASKIKITKYWNRYGQQLYNGIDRNKWKVFKTNYSSYYDLTLLRQT